MFEKIRAVLDEIESKARYSYIACAGCIPDELENKLVLALYDELNIYYLCRKLKVLSDKDVPDEYKRIIFNHMRGKES